MKAAAVACWALAWVCAGFIPAAFFAAKNGKRDVAWAELAIGVGGAMGLTSAAPALW